MNRKRYINTLYAMVVVLFTTMCFSRCAVTMTPSGGPIDTLPPVIVSMTPPDYLINAPTYWGNQKIVVEFNEYVQLKDQQKEFFTSPKMKKKPQLLIRGKSVVIQIRDTLMQNTTYALNFGSTIRDNNEGNPFNSFRYVFSTGATIDSMYMSGYTADSYTADSVSKSYIYYFPADSIKEDLSIVDSVMFNYEPAVIGRAEDNGIFIAQNLKPIDYRVYAFEDTNDNQLYEPGVDLVGFIPEVQNPARLPEFAIWYDSLRQYVSADPQLYFRMFKDKAHRRQNLADALRPDQHRAELFFAADYPQIDSLVFEGIPKDSIIIEPITDGNDTLNIWFNVASKSLPDTIKGRIVYQKQDSLNQMMPEGEDLELVWRLIETKEQEKEREKLEKEREEALKNGEEWEEPKVASKFGVKMDKSGAINPEKGIILDFDAPLIDFDSTAVTLMYENDEKQIMEIPVHFEQDTASMRRWHVSAPWKELGRYTLTIPQGAMESVPRYVNDSIIGEYTLMDPEDYARVIIDVKGKTPESKYIVQLYNESNKLIEEKVGVTTGQITFNYVAPGEVKLRIVEDSNANGMWDSGVLVKHIEPERAEVYLNAKGEEIFTTKKNWDVELEMDMNTIFAPVTMQSLIHLLDSREMERLRKIEEEKAEKKPNQQPQQQQQSSFGTGSGFGGAMGLPGI